MRNKIKPIKLILMDVDGVLTDGGIILGSNGFEMKIFNVQDGAGVTLARKAGLKVGIITGRESEAVARRVQELKMDVVSQGHFNKLGEYERIKNEMNLDDSEIAYIGDDILDLCILERVGFAAAPQNARPEVKSQVAYVTRANGGNGAVRELIDMILKEKGLWDQAVSLMK